MNLKWVFWLFILVIINCPTKSLTADDDYQIGVGIADITGPAAEINMVSLKDIFVDNFITFFSSDLPV